MLHTRLFMMFKLKPLDRHFTLAQPHYFMAVMKHSSHRFTNTQYQPASHYPHTSPTNPPTHRSTTEAAAPPPHLHTQKRGGNGRQQTVRGTSLQGLSTRPHSKGTRHSRRPRHRTRHTARTRRPAACSTATRTRRRSTSRRASRSTSRSTSTAPTWMAQGASR